jgi:ParB family chromosome partitioning protein
MDVRSIRVDTIEPDPEQPRKTFDDAKIEELAASLREHGLLQPIRIRQDPMRAGRYFIIAGERRWRAAKKVPLVEIDAVVVQQRQRDDRTRVEQVVENLQREEVNAVEEGQCYRTLLEVWGCSQAELARKVAKSPAHISRMIAVLDLSEETRSRIVAGELNYADALRQREREKIAAAGVKPTRTRRPPEVPRGTMLTPFGTVKLKRGAKLEDLVAHLTNEINKRRKEAA